MTAAPAPAAGRRVLMIGNDLRALLIFRGHLVQALVAEGCETVVAAPQGDPELAARVAALGARFAPLPLTRSGRNPLSEALVFWRVLALIRRVRPEVVFAYTIKPVVYGMIAAGLLGVRRRVALLSGMGYAFIEGPGAARRLTRALAEGAYWLAFRFADLVIFQNPDDEALALDRGFARAGRTARVRGSGVDLDSFPHAPLPEAPPTFVMIARLLRDKGVHEYVAAARLVKAARPDARFRLVGSIDANPASATEAEVEAWRREGVVELPGYAADVRPWLHDAHVFVLPSYREGTPRTGLEALASGRAIVATDVPGCREIVVVGENGFLAPAREVESLAAAMLDAIAEDDRLAAMGRRSRELAETHYDVHAVNRDMVRLLLGRSA